MSRNKLTAAVPSPVAEDADDFDAKTAARVCWHYFKEGQTQEEVARRLGFTRKRINRIIAQALSSGLVQITIDSQIGACAELESRLIAQYRLRRAIVVPSPAPDLDVRTVVGAAAGQYISDQLGPSETLGISWGGTIHAAAQNLRRRHGGNTVVSLVGGLAMSGPINPYDNAAMMARALGATCRYVTTPMIADSRELRDALVRSTHVAAALAAVRSVNRALLSAVDLTNRSRALEYGVITRDTLRSLRTAGAVGDIAGHYLNASGSLVSHPLVDRVISVDLTSLRAVGELVLAAGGAHKAAIIRAGILARLCHVLITDEAAAEALLAF
ncbi:sugar-binding transcriptional regulator [Reyranella soli]|uniref:DNA-binding transcriptional regulator n=1 Tax=Reyranella soli TaxID=1230389 RepID=A0A512NMR6_9HYPH|nr:sugar-binding domain-containing protein [Reyranella soli]GEP60212.1 DNA-binding transcriptional regulator [Reyranella soli]